MPAVRTTPPTVMSFVAIVFAVRRHVTNSAAQVMNRQLMAVRSYYGAPPGRGLRGRSCDALTFRYGQRRRSAWESPPFARGVARAIGRGRRQTFVGIEGGSSLSARLSAVASSASCAWLMAKIRHWATLPGRYLRISVKGSSDTVSEEPLTEILKYLPGKVAQCRIFAMSHAHDAELATALKRALNEDPPSIPTNV